MKTRSTRWLAWALWLLAMGLLVGGVAFAAPSLAAPSEDLIFAFAFGTVGALLFGPVGAFLAARRPSNPIGWLLAGYGVVMALFWFSLAYVGQLLDVSIGRPGSLPGADWVAWAFAVVWYPGYGLLFLLLLFPHGRPPSPRWRPLAPLGVVFYAVVALQRGRQQRRVMSRDVTWPAGWVPRPCPAVCCPASTTAAVAGLAPAGSRLQVRPSRRLRQLSGVRNAHGIGAVSGQLVSARGRVPQPAAVRRVLQEPVAGSASAAGVQPPPVRPPDVAGEPLAELLADVGHGRPFRRQRLLPVSPPNRRSLTWPCCQPAMTASAGMPRVGRNATTAVIPPRFATKVRRSPPGWSG